MVIAADWMANGAHVITASWDHTANMYDAETGVLLNCFTGALKLFEWLLVAVVVVCGGGL